jgi:hypothetical protein
MADLQQAAELGGSDPYNWEAAIMAAEGEYKAMGIQACAQLGF